MRRKIVKESELRAKIQEINALTNSPAEPYTKAENGEYIANIGNYHLSCAYGGYTLHRMQNSSGGVSTPIEGGYFSKRELLEKLNLLYWQLKAQS